MAVFRGVYYSCLYSAQVLGAHLRCSHRIVDRRRRGRGYQYLVRWRGYGREHDSWLAASKVDDLEALDDYLAEFPLPNASSS